jgi:hypothetical protein
MKRLLNALDVLEFDALSREAFYRRHPGTGGNNPDYHYACRQTVAELRAYLTGQWPLPEPHPMLEALRAAVEPGKPMTPEVVTKVRAAWGSQWPENP